LQDKFQIIQPHSRFLASLGCFHVFEACQPKFIQSNPPTSNLLSAAKKSVHAREPEIYDVVNPMIFLGRPLLQRGVLFGIAKGSEIDKQKMQWKNRIHCTKTKDIRQHNLDSFLVRWTENDVRDTNNFSCMERLPLFTAMSCKWKLAKKHEQNPNTFFCF